MKIKILNSKNSFFGILLLAVMVMIACGPQPRSERDGGEHSGEQREGGEHEGEGREGKEHGGEGSESSSEHSGGSEANNNEQEGSGANALSPAETYDVVKGGARLILNYDADSKTFLGSVENVSDRELDQVRVEIHLSNGTELGPTTAVNMDPGQSLEIELPATGEDFETWAPHAEVGRNEHGAEGESGESNDGHSEGEGHEEGGEGESGDPSSPILALNSGWDGEVNGVRVAMSSDSAAGSFSGIVENASDQPLCFIQIELNLKQGTTTVVELGPAPVGDLEPDEQANVELLVADEPEAEGLVFDAWEIHPEVFDCDGEGPTGGEGHRGEGGENGHDEGGEDGHDEGSGG